MVESILGLVTLLGLLFITSKIFDIFKLKNFNKEYSDIYNPFIKLNKKFINFYSDDEFKKSIKLINIDIDDLYDFEIFFKDTKKINYKIMLNSKVDKDSQNNIKFFIEKEIKTAFEEIDSDKNRPNILNLIMQSIKITFPSFIFNAGLLNSFLKKLIKGISRQQLYENTIVGLLVEQKIKSDTKSYILIISAVIIHILFSFLPNYSINLLLILFLITLLCLLHLNQKILEFRINRGYYGSNEYEVREMLIFISEHSNKRQFSDKDGIKEIFPEAEIANTKLISIEGGVVLA